MVPIMNRKKVILLAVSLVFMASLLAGVVSAQGEGIGKALGKIGEIFSSIIGIVSLDKVLGGDKVALAYSYFIIWLIFFAGTYYGTGFVFKDRPRIQIVVAIGFSLFVLMIPPATMTGIAKLYSMAFTLVIWLVPVGVALIVGWKVESKAAKAVLYFGLLLLLTQANGVVQAYFGPDFTQNEWYSLFYILYFVAIIGFIWNLVTMWDVFRGAGDKLAGRVGDLADKGVDYLTKDKKKEEEAGEEEEREEKAERKVIRRNLRKVTKKAKKSSEQILEDLETIRKYIDEFGKDKKAREKVIKAANDIPPREHEIFEQLTNIGNAERILEARERNFINKLSAELNSRGLTVNPTVKLAVEQKIRDEMKLAAEKFKIDNKIKDMLKKLGSYNREFGTLLRSFINTLRRGRVESATVYLDKAIELEEEISKIFDALIHYENYLERLTVEEITVDVEDTSNVVHKITLRA